jgi:hypothetical protein
MSYKPDEKTMIDYLYGELEGQEKAKVEEYFRLNPEARLQFEKLAGVKSMLREVKDKEVIAPPIVLGEANQRRLWDIPYLKTVMSIAASLVLVILAARVSGARVSISENEFRLSFGEVPAAPMTEPVSQPSLTAVQVQQMIRQSLDENNSILNTNWKESQKALEASIRTNLVTNSGKMDDVIKKASSASQEQIQQYVSAMQTENMQLVKDYFKLTASEQKQYIEGLLVDFAKYLQQQQKDEMQLVQVRLSNIEENTNVFKQETEHILTSIISTVGNTPAKTSKQY